MHGIKKESGVNDCYWNIDGKCTNQHITHNDTEEKATIPIPSSCTGGRCPVSYGCSLVRDGILCHNRLWQHFCNA